jgi:hypothetical protein
MQSVEAPRAPRDTIRAGRDALLASLERPLAPPGRGLEQVSPAAPAASRSAALLGGQGSAFDDDSDLPKEIPAVPSLAVLRPRRTTGSQATESGEPGKPRKRLPSWDDVLFGSAPAHRETS